MPEWSYSSLTSCHPRTSGVLAASDELEVSASTFAEAEKLMQVELTKQEREIAAGSWDVNMASLYERRTGPRKVTLELIRRACCRAGRARYPV